MQTGTLLAQRYRIDAQLGEGGMGVVYRAHDMLLDRPVAIKVLSPQIVGEGAERLLREARSVAQLDHPHIVAVHDAGEVDGQPFIVMQLVSGKSLRDISVSLDQAVQITKQVCLALEYAHEKGLIHRDIKPENIMVTDGTVAKLMDFGLARSEGRTRLTQAGTIVGTVAYMAPEQVLRGDADARSDLYSLGCVLYETVTGRPPFAGDDPISIISQHLQVPPVAPHWYKPEVPPELEGIILKLMAKDPAERYASARDVLAALEQLTPTLPASIEVAPISPALLLGTVLRSRLIGRDAELRELKSSVEMAASAHGQVVLVEGEPGIGKTRLLQEVQVYARLRGFVVLIGRCYEQETGVPYLPFIELLQSRFRDMARADLLDELGVTAPEFVKLIPEVRETLRDVEPSPPLEPVQERLRLFASVARHLTGLSRRTPLVLVLEDLHWADAASLSLLQHLARALRKDRLLILGSYRDVEVDSTHPLGGVLQEMNRERLYSAVNLRRLLREGVGAMVQTMFELRQVTEEFLDALYSETEGNPFFVEEVLKSLVEEGGIFRKDGGWERKDIGEINVPKSIKEVVGRRLQRVSDPCQRVLSLGAVIGRRFHFEVLQAVGELPEEDLLNVLEEAMRAQLVREESDAGEVQYDFAHALIREVLYERLSLRRRMTLHQKVGETLERQYLGRTEVVVEDLAHHFTRAPHGEGLAKAIRYSLDAAGRAITVFAHEEAVRYYQNALDLLADTGDERRLAEAHEAIGTPLLYLDNPQAAIAHFEAALSFFQRQSTPGDVGRLHRKIGNAARDRSEAIAHLEQALQVLDPTEQVEEAIRAHLGLAGQKTFGGMVEEAEQHAVTAFDLARVQGVLWMQSSARRQLGLTAVWRADVDAALAHFAEAIAIARQADDPDGFRSLRSALNNMAVTLRMRGRRAEEGRLFTEALEVARRTRDVFYIAFQSDNLGGYLASQGEWNAARRCLEDALELGPSPLVAIGLKSSLCILTGEWEEGIAIGRERLTSHRERGNLQGTFESAAYLALMNLNLGRLGDALEAALVAAEVTERNHVFLLFPSAVSVAEGLALGGDHLRCERFSSRVEALSRAADSPTGLMTARFGQGLLALERGDPAAAARLLEEAIPLAKTHGPVLHARGLRWLARALARRQDPGDREGEKGALEECLTLLEGMGETRVAGMVRAELAAL